VEWAIVATITVGAAVLRLIHIGQVPPDPFYDAAVRSMTTSWHNFFFGAYEPGGSVSIDKPPIDLWLQVISVKLLGFSSTTLKLPEAFAGTASVPLLYVVVRRLWSAPAGIAAAVAMAVLPIEVITARSDTMDAVMMLALLLALFAAVRAVESGRSVWLLAAAAALGVAFNVKLLESIVALPGIALFAYLGMPGTRLRRLVRLLLPGMVYVVVALAWLTATLLFPAHDRPYAIGSTNGSAWNAAFVFNGTERLSGKTTEVGQTQASVTQHGNGTSHRVTTGTTPAPPSPTRLLARSGELPAKWLGWEALVALLLGVAVVVSLRRARDGAQRVQRATAIGVFVWLLTGVVLFSAMVRLHPRYVESFTPAVAAMYGIGVAWVARRGNRGQLGALLLMALLAIPLVASVQAVRAKTSDAGNVGALGGEEQRLLSSYLLAHQGGARYELAAGEATNVASLIVRDVRPVLMLTTYNGLPLTSVARLKALIARGEVRYAFLNSVCGPHPSSTVAGCAPAALWVRAHGTDVSLHAGLHARGVLWRLPAGTPPESPLGRAAPHTNRLKTRSPASARPRRSVA
jgi:4-amino-4-deoxy-L-arabinose transferase-like glycosyltransferase